MLTSLLIDDHSLDVVDTTDFLRGPKVEQLRLQGVEHVYHITALEGKIYFRSYRFVIYHLSFFYFFQCNNYEPQCLQTLFNARAKFH